MYIVEALRTPRGRGLPARKGRPAGSLHLVRPVELLSVLYRALETRGVDPTLVEELVLGCATQTHDLGSNIAKVSSLYAGWQVPAGTINRACTSGLDALRFGALQIQGGADVVVAGGVESMSRVPMFSDNGPWYADPEVARATGFIHMGVAADLLATREGFSRSELDELAAESQTRATRARNEGRFRSIVDVPRPDGSSVEKDENIREETTPALLAGLAPAYAKLGASGADAVALGRYPELGEVQHLHTPGTSPALADAASVAVLASEDGVRKLGLGRRGRILSFANHAAEPILMLDGNVPSVGTALQTAGLAPASVDVFEINESFAAVPLHFRRAFDLDSERVNPNGGAIAMGHPLGATGGILLSTALDELERADRETAVLSICGAAGVTMSVVLERA